MVTEESEHPWCFCAWCMGESMRAHCSLCHRLLKLQHLALAFVTSFVGRDQRKQVFSSRVCSLFLVTPLLFIIWSRINMISFKFLFTCQTQLKIFNIVKLLFKLCPNIVRLIYKCIQFILCTSNILWRRKRICHIISDKACGRRIDFCFFYLP